MHLVALVVLVQIACAIHCLRTGRPPWWLLIILLFPLLGSLIYVIMEVLPGLAGRREVRMAKAAAVRTIDPDREIRAARDALDTADTAANRIAMADAFAERENWPEAMLHYRAAIDRAPLPDRATHLKLARANLEAGNAAEAKRVIESLPASRSAGDEDRAGLLLGRALAELGEAEAALALFADVGTRLPGGEAQCRQAGLLLELGRDAEAAVPLAEAERRLRRLDRYEKMRDADMYAWAERTLADLRTRGF
jgi:hypothetical protein